MDPDPVEKLKFRELLSALWYTHKLGFKISKFWYIMYYIDNIAQFLLPVGAAYFSSKVIGELVRLVSTNTHEISQNMYIYIGITIVFISAQRIAGTLNSYIYARMTYIFDLKLWSEYLDRLSNLDIYYHEDPAFKTKLRKVNEALQWRMMSIYGNLTAMIGAVFGVLAIAGIFLSINIFLIAFIVIPIIIDYLINTKFGAMVWGIWDFKGDEKKHAGNALSAFDDKDVLKEAKIYGFGGYISKKYNDANKSFIDAVIGKSNVKYGLLSLNTVFAAVLFGGIQIYLIFQTVIGRLSIEGYSFYFQSLSQIGSTFNNLQDFTSRLYENGLYAWEYKKFMELPKVIERSEKPVVVENKAPKIEFKNVSFKYPRTDNYIFKNLSFVIDSGEKIALVGENGAGKSTIIKLLARFYDPTEGEILINDIPLKNLDLEKYYKLWGVLFQYFARYWFTLQENIGLGNTEDMANTELIKQAGHKAGLEKVLDKLPHQYENMLSTDFKDGKDLSGGEWQKVGIARGMFADPKFIVLDEPTSALDALAEAQVFEEIEKIAGDTTMLIVSHRFATVRNADKILVLENGEITEQGSHESLMAEQGLYYKMFTSQAEGYK